MTPFQISFRGGTVEAHDASGPVFDGGSSQFHAYRSLRNMQHIRAAELTRPKGKRPPFIKQLIQTAKRFSDLSLVIAPPVGGGTAELVLNVIESSYPGPSGTQQKSVYDGRVQLLWQRSEETSLFGFVRTELNGSRIIDVRVTLTFDTTKTDITGRVDGEFVKENFWDFRGGALGARPPVEGHFKSDLPTRQDLVALFDLRELKLSGEWRI
jgi:hypothetical protein